MAKKRMIRVPKFACEVEREIARFWRLVNTVGCEAAVRQMEYDLEHALKRAS